MTNEAFLIDAAISQENISEFVKRFRVDWQNCLSPDGFSWNNFYREYVKIDNPENEILGLLAQYYFAFFEEVEAKNDAITKLLQIEEIANVFFKGHIFFNEFFPRHLISCDGNIYVILNINAKEHDKKYGRYVEGKVFFPFGMKKIKGKPGYYITFIPNGLYFVTISGINAVSFVKEAARKFNAMYPNLLELGNIDFVMIDKLRELFFEKEFENVKITR